MTKIRWSADQLQAFQDEFNNRLGFYPLLRPVVSMVHVAITLKTCLRINCDQSGKLSILKQKDLLTGTLKRSYKFIILRNLASLRRSDAFD